MTNRATWSRVFGTRQAGDPPWHVRTHGRVLEHRGGSAWPTEFACAAPISHTPHVTSAHGKVAVLRLGLGKAEVASFQLADADGQAEIAACSNATAAAAARFASTSDCLTPTLDVVLPGACDAHVVARVCSRNGSAYVRQTWLGVRIDLGHDTDVDRRRVVVCSGALNNYLVVRTRPGEPLSAFSLADALALWRHFGMDLAPLLSRIAVVDSDYRDGPKVKFFTCGTRAHPSAPATGLAVLACAARAFDWLPSSPTTVGTPRGAVRVPRVEVGRDGGAEVQFPEVVVTFAGAPDSPTPGA